MRMAEEKKYVYSGPTPEETKKALVHEHGRRRHDHMSMAQEACAPATCPLQDHSIDQSEDHRSIKQSEAAEQYQSILSI